MHGRTHMRRLLRIAISCACFFAPAAAFAQASITGVVRDSSGAVLPGVTVEATSPALIEKARTVVTRRHRAVSDRHAPARHVHPHVHAVLVLNRAPGRGRAAGYVHGHDRRRPPHRLGRRNHHRDRDRRSWTCRARRSSGSSIPRSSTRFRPAGCPPASSC